MSSTSVWKSVFTAWPEGIARRGILISSLNEATPFKGFMVKDEMVLLERVNPDAMGARYILIGFGEINSVKFTDPIKESVFAESGYTGKLSGT